MILSCTVSEILRLIGWKMLIFPTLTRRSAPVEFRDEFNHEGTRVMGLSYSEDSMRCLMLLWTCDPVPACDIQTDRQTDGFTTASTALCIETLLTQCTISFDVSFYLRLGTCHSFIHVNVVQLSRWFAAVFCMILCKVWNKIHLHVHTHIRAFLCTGIKSASGKSSLIKPASATLLTLAMMLQATFSTSQGSLTHICIQY